jgi:acyl-CoA dehydrogenase
MSTDETYEDDNLRAIADRLLDSTCSVEAVEKAERDGWLGGAWEALAEAEFHRIGVEEAAGGSGGSLQDLMVVLRSVGGHAAPVPLAEAAIGAWLLSSSGHPLGDGLVTTVPFDSGIGIESGRLRGEALVPWAARAHQLAVLVDSPEGPVVVGLLPHQVEVTQATNLAGEPRDRVRVDIGLRELVVRPAAPIVTLPRARARWRLSRLAMSSGALDAMRDLTIEYTSIREQFGRPIAKFQAVQQHLVTLAEAAIRSSAATDLATLAVERDDFEFEIAAASIVVDAAVVEGTRAAHQAHGAIGFTREYRLQQLTRRAWAWRHELPRPHKADIGLGERLVKSGSAGLFATIAR